MRHFLKLAVCLAAVPLLAGCEYDGAAYLIDGKDHSISLVREQRWLWSDEVAQSIVVSRMPTCLRRHEIRPGSAGTLKMEVYEAGDYLWALKQGKNWYLVGTEACQLQRWTEPPAEPPGRLVGTFSRKSGHLEFIPADKPAAPLKPAAE